MLITMNSNFVDIVGYQFEKVHTAAIKWLLDSNNTLIEHNEKFNVLRNIYIMCNISIPFKSSDIKSIQCKTEVSIGKGKRVDLVVEILLKSGDEKYIVIEMKVDTIAKKDQLEATYNGFHGRENAIFVLFLFGSSQICQIPKHRYFNTFLLNDIVSVFNNFNCNHYIYTDWIESLQKELKRSQAIKDVLPTSTHIKNKDYWRENGYRTHFTAFYYLYNHLKSNSKNEIDWNIYSGNNNPIMNWEPGWIDKIISDKKITFYWEFNYEELILKVKLPIEEYLSGQELQQLKTNIISIVSNVPTIQGNRVRMQPNPKIYNSLYKWKFNFLEDNFEKIMKDTEFIIENIHPLLETSNWELR
ncbi:TPA: PD-(D/E)XK nuclease family protein [Bacillus cereus]|nr:PD-(D/E)XK nuclease family protein [Bacillus cereus]